MKKVLAVLFILVGAFLALAIIARLPLTIRTIIVTTPDAYGVGYTIGTCLTTLLMIGAVYFLFKYAVRWLKGRTERPAMTIDEEFKINSK